MKTIFYLILFCCSCHSFAQITIAKDTLVWTDGTRSAGTVMSEDKATGQVQFKTEDGVLHIVSASSITALKRTHSTVDNNAPPSDIKANNKSQVNTVPDAAIDWSDPNIPQRAVKKHNVGIGLTVAGTLLIVGGIAMTAAGAATNGQTTTVTNGYYVQTSANIGAIGVVGVLGIVAGLPMMIVGAVKIAKSKRIARASLIHP